MKLAVMGSGGWGTALALVLLLKFKVSIPKVIGLCALLGLICFGIF